jgi:hypothetical protein
MPFGPSELGLALNAVSPKKPLPPELPVAHLTIARWLTPILNAGALLPRRCAVFDEDLLYFSYGGVFFRPDKRPTENASELPVGLVFTPEVLDRCSRLFPFDSGAMMKRLFGDQWFQTMHPFEQRFAITNGNLNHAARALVACLYAENHRYLEGRPIKDLGSAPTALQVLHAFLSENFTAKAVDHRHRSIEALTKVPVSLGEDLMWIGLPMHRLAKAKKILRGQMRKLPVFYTYSWSRNHSPDAIAEVLQREAQRTLISSYER